MHKWFEKDLAFLVLGMDNGRKQFDSVLLRYSRANIVEMWKILIMPQRKPMKTVKIYLFELWLMRFSDLSNISHSLDKNRLNTLISL